MGTPSGVRPPLGAPVAVHAAGSAYPSRVDDDGSELLVAAPVEVRWVTGATSSHASAEALDLGEGGLRLLLPGYVPDTAGTQLDESADRRDRGEG